jgi:uroporphyrinogen-III synthase
VLLVTRAAEDATAWVAALAARGVPALAAPCVEFNDVAFTLAPFRDLPVDLLITSPRAAGRVEPSDIAAAWRVLALAPRTRGALEARGIVVDLAVDGGAAALARRCGTGRVPVLVGSDRAGDEVRSVRTDTRLVIAYRTVAPAALPADALDATRGEFDLVFASPSAVENFAALVPGAIERASARWCLGRTTAAAVQARGLPARMVGEWTVLGEALAEAGSLGSSKEEAWSA